MDDTNNTTESEKSENKGYVKKGGNGGHREGSGRKPKEKLPGKFNARELFYKKVDDRWDKIMAVMDSWIEDKDKEAVKWMVDQRIGKAAQHTILGNEDNEVLKITVVPYGENNKPAQIPDGGILQ